MYALKYRVQSFKDVLIDEQISSFCPYKPKAEAFNPNNATQTHSIFKKIHF